MDFAVPADRWVKMKESEKINKLDLAKEAEKSIRHENDVDINCSWSPWYSHQRHGKKTVESGDQRKNQDHPDHSNFKIR